MKTFGRIYRVILEPDMPKGYVAIAPAVPGLVAHGETEEDALNRMKQSLQEHLEHLEQGANPLPDDKVDVVWDEEDEEAGARIVAVEV